MCFRSVWLSACARLWDGWAESSSGSDGRTWTGEEPADVAKELKNVGADVVGVNCMPGPQAALDILEEMSKAAKVKLSVQPNAGHPRVVEREVSYPVTPGSFAEHMPRFVAAGAVIIGGCCGTTPEHTSAMHDSLRHSKDAPLPETQAAPAIELELPPEDLDPEDVTLR